jgi:CRISPR-associated endonuclease Csn1
VEDNSALQGKTWKRVQSLGGLEGAVKVRVNHIGQIVAVGEY